MTALPPKNTVTVEYTILSDVPTKYENHRIKTCLLFEYIDYTMPGGGLLS